MLADGGRFVIRYDHRDTGRSVTYEPGRPGYTRRRSGRRRRRRARCLRRSRRRTWSASRRAGRSRSCSRSTTADRVLSLVLISTSPATPRRPRAATADRGVRAVRVDRRGATGPIADSVRRVPGRLLARARGRRAPVRRGGDPRPRPSRRRARPRLRRGAEPRPASPQGEPSPRPLSSIAAPTLVIHGTADPMFPIEHGEALAEEIPGATLLPLEGPVTASTGPTGRAIDPCDPRAHRGPTRGAATMDG